MTDAKALDGCTADVDRLIAWHAKALNCHRPFGARGIAAAHAGSSPAAPRCAWRRRIWACPPRAGGAGSRCPRCRRSTAAPWCPPPSRRRRLRPAASAGTCVRQGLLRTACRRHAANVWKVLWHTRHGADDRSRQTDCRRLSLLTVGCHAPYKNAQTTWITKAPPAAAADALSQGRSAHICHRRRSYRASDGSQQASVIESQR